MTGACPKHVVIGPCGGVQADGRCEVEPVPCVFPAPAEWAEPVPAVPLRTVPMILTDFSSEPYSLRMLRSVARTLAPVSDAVLVGEHQDRPDFPPTLLASMLADAGLRPWMTLACRDRNRIVLEEELSGLCHLGVDAVLCVTGDARAYDVRPDVTQVFDLDGPRLAALAAQVAADLGPEYYIPAGCRGSGQPVALDWLLAGLQPGPGDLLVDIGAGVGGPAAALPTGHFLPEEAPPLVIAALGDFLASGL